LCTSVEITIVFSYFLVAAKGRFRLDASLAVYNQTRDENS